MELKDTLSIISVIGMAIGLLYQHFGIITKLRDEIEKTRNDFNKAISDMQKCQSEEIRTISTDIADIKTKTELLWKCIETRVVDILKTYPSEVDKDILLDKLKERSLTLQEAEKLRTILDCELIDKKENQFAYVLVITRLEQIIYDLRKEKVNIDGERIDLAT